MCLPACVMGEWAGCLRLYGTACSESLVNALCAQVRAHVAAIQAAGCLTKAQPLAALRAAAAAVHACPWDARWRRQLASCAAAVSPSYGAAAARAAPVPLSGAVEAPVFESLALAGGSAAPSAPLLVPLLLVPLTAAAGPPDRVIVSYPPEPISPAPPPAPALSWQRAHAARLRPALRVAAAAGGRALCRGLSARPPGPCTP